MTHDSLKVLLTGCAASGKTLVCWLNTQTLWIEASKTISSSAFLHIVKRMQETCRNNSQSE